MATFEDFMKELLKTVNSQKKKKKEEEQNDSVLDYVYRAINQSDDIAPTVGGGGRKFSIMDTAVTLAEEQERKNNGFSTVGKLSDSKNISKGILGIGDSDISPLMSYRDSSVKSSNSYLYDLKEREKRLDTSLMELSGTDSKKETKTTKEPTKTTKEQRYNQALANYNAANKAYEEWLAKNNSDEWLNAISAGEVSQKEIDAFNAQQQPLIDNMKKTYDALDKANKEHTGQGNGIHLFKKGALGEIDLTKRFKDGYQFGDIIGTGVDTGKSVAKAVLGTAGDAGLEAFRGLGNFSEGIADTLGYGVADVADLIGFDEYADDVRYRAEEEMVNDWLFDADRFLEKYSVLDTTADSVASGVGQVGAIVGAGTAAKAAGLGAKGVTILTRALQGMSGYGHGVSEARKNNATDAEARAYGLLSAGAEVIGEMLFSSLGKTAAKAGIDVGMFDFDDVVAQKVGKLFTSDAWKNAAQGFVKGLGEGVEEGVTGFLQGAAKKITYMKEEDFSKILEDENLFEQFFVGALTGDVVQGVEVIKANKAGRDLITGLNADEQTVVDKLVEDEIAKAEKDGKKVKKGDVLSEITEKLEKGYISVDDIERILGGDSYSSIKNQMEHFFGSDTYKTYKSTVDSEDAISKEYGELGQKTDATLEEQFRYADLKQKMEDIKANSKRGELKAQLEAEASRINEMRANLRSEISERVKDGKLAESYRELVRSTQKFEADPSKYKSEAAKKTIQNILDGGIANNTRKHHEFIDSLLRMSEDKGIEFDLTSNAKLKGTRHDKGEGIATNGWKTKDGKVVLNLDSPKVLESTVGHEVTHVLENSKDEYDTLQKAVFALAETKGEYKSRLEAVTDLYGTYDPDADPVQELTADLVGEYLFNDSDFIKTLSTKHRNVFQKIYDEIKYLYKVVTAGSKEARQLAKVKKAFEDAYRAAKKADAEADVEAEETSDSEVQHSISVTDPKKIDFLENQEHIVTYKAMQLIDGKLYPPMAAKVKGEDGKYTMQNPSQIGVWQEAVEDPTNIKFGKNGKGYYNLNKGNGKSVKAAYNPYEHSSNLVLNDQFEEAYQRDNIVTVECVIPASEMTSGYQAEYAKDATGMLDWKKGVVAGKLKDNQRKVYLSRWLKPVRILTDAETAQMYKDIVGDTPVPFNVVPPGLLKELENLGATIDYDGSPGYQYHHGKGTQYSLSTDSNGNQLTDAQEEFFKDSVVRDDNGNLKVMYHGTSRGGFNVFDTYGGNHGLFGVGSYFTDSKTIGESYTKKGKGSSPQVYETYLNITNPIDMDAQANPEEWQNAFEDVDFPESGTNEDFYRAVEEYCEDEMMYKWDAAEMIQSGLESGMGYDGITHIGGGRVNADGERHQVYIAFNPEQIKSIDNQNPTSDADIRYSMSEDSEGNRLTEEVDEFFKDSKMRDENGKLKVMYHGSQNGGFHTFQNSYSDDGASFFFVDRNEVARTYSGTSETYAARTFHTADDFNSFFAEIGAREYKVVETDGKFQLLEDGDVVATSDTADGLYEEFRDWSGKGYGNVNYKVYLNLVNPFIVDAKGAEWNGLPNIKGEDTKYEYIKVISDNPDNTVTIEYALTGDPAPVRKDVVLFADFDDGLSEQLANLEFGEVLRDVPAKPNTTRDYAEYAKRNGYDGVIFENINDNGGYGYWGRATVAVAFDSNQIKSVANSKPTLDEDIRYSLSRDSEGRKLAPAIAKRFGNSKAVDENGDLKVLYHGTASGEFSVFDKAKGDVEGDFGSGFYFTDDAYDVEANYEGGGPDFEQKVELLAERFEQDEDIPYDEAKIKAREELYKGSHKFEVYLNIENPAVVGRTMLFDADSYLEQYSEEDYEDYDEYIADVEQLVADDIENIVWEVEKNVDVYNTDGLSNILFEAYYEGGIGIEELKRKINELYLEDSEGKLVGNEVTRQIIESLGYDGIIDPTVSSKFNMELEESTTHYIVFKPNQIKSVTNQNPTDNPDIHRSLSYTGEAQRGRGTYGSDIRLRNPAEFEFAPLAGDADAVNVPNVNPVWNMFPDNLSPADADLDKLQQTKESLESRMLEAVGAEDFDTFYQINAEYESVMGRIAELENYIAESDAGRVGSLGDADAPPEIDAPIPDDYSRPASTPDPFADRDVSAVGNMKVKAYMDEHPEVKPFFREEANIMLTELADTTKGERWYNDEVYYESGGESGWYGVSRNTSDDIAYLLDSLRMTYADIEKGLIAIAEDSPKKNAAAKRIEFVLHDRLAKGYTDFHSGKMMPPNQGYIDLLNEMQANLQSAEALDSLVASEPPPAEDFAPVVTQPTTQQKAPVESDVAPVREEYEAIRPQRKKQPKMVRVDTPAEEQHTAQILTESPTKPKEKASALHKAVELLVDKGAVFERLGKRLKNRELEAKYNALHYSHGNAQTFIGNGDPDAGVESLVSIMKQVGNNDNDFFSYLYHVHNIDRMTLEQRGLGENKAVYGDHVTADMSRAIAQRIETQHPEFRGLATKVYKLNKYLRGKMVDGGLISQETANLWEKMYPHYVPISRADYEAMAVNVPLDTKRTGVNAPIKRATGGNGDISPMFDTMAKRVIQTFRAVDRNDFGTELMKSLGTATENTATDFDAVMDGIDAHEELLQEGKNGNAPTFTVFVNGEKVTFEITKEMYDAMKPTDDVWAGTNKVLNTISNVRRGLITEYNPVFLATNAIKDAQDVLLNSQHPMATYANFPRAWAEMLGNGKWYNEYMKNGGGENTYFERDTNTFAKDKSKFRKFVGFAPDVIAYANNFIERVPRLAEYIASREADRSIKVSMLDAARVTTNFAAGGDVTKWANRNGATFLNASVQGATQFVRNVQEARMQGFKGWAKLAGKSVLAALPAVLLNGLLWRDDEEYEELSDYVKENYYIVGKFGDGQFVRIPKGRTVAVIQEAFRQMRGIATGEDEADFEKFAQLLLNNLAPNNPLDNNVISPFVQAFTNKAWHGGDIVPQSMQDVPVEEQYDESTDMLSRWLGEHFDPLNLGPTKINYILDQYSGGIGDTILPMLTPEAERGEDSPVGKLVSPWVDKFTTDSVLNNQTVTDFYDLKDTLTISANSTKATDDDLLKSKYMNSVNSELSDLYKEKREIQNSLKYSDSEKYKMVRDLQAQINERMKDAMATHEDISYEEDVKTGVKYAVIGDRYFKLDDEDHKYEWSILSDEEAEKYKITSAAGDANYATDGKTHYRWVVPSEDTDDEPHWQKITDKQLAKQKDVTKKLDITPDEYWSNQDDESKDMYSWVYDNPEKFEVAKAVTSDFNKYWQYKQKIDSFDAKDAQGNTVNGLKKERVTNYIESLPLDAGEKMILHKMYYPKDDSNNYEIVDYINGRSDISYKEMCDILIELGFTIESDGVTITWD